MGIQELTRQMIIIGCQTPGIKYISSSPGMVDDPLGFTFIGNKQKLINKYRVPDPWYYGLDVSYLIISSLIIKLGVKGFDRDKIATSIREKVEDEYK